MKESGKRQCLIDDEVGMRRERDENSMRRRGVNQEEKEERLSAITARRYSSPNVVEITLLTSPFCLASNGAP